MTLSAGTRLGPYEIVSPLGAGGMGEVYLARDTRLARDVAIKVLPAHLADTPDARARFEREARAVSSLNHPNICTLYDVGRESGVDFLVLERIEGETLAARLTRGPLPIDDAIRLGLQMADALDRAHRSGIVHRDLKPGNIMLTKSGAKLLDFGLARPTAVTTGAGSGSLAPTLTTPLTAEGSIVGTFQYMAPEQLEGKESDPRTDLWAFGAVLFQSITGKPAFEGRSQASLIAAILERQPPPISTITPLAPPALDRLVRACLAKDPDERIQTAHDVKLQLQWIAEGGSQAGVPAPVAARRRTREQIAWSVAALGLLAAGTFAALWISKPQPANEVLRYAVTLPAGQRVMSWPKLSPDGSLLAFTAMDSGGTPRIWLRPMDSFAATPIPGTEGTGRPFWSPDGRSIAFTIDDKLKKIAVSGGPAVLIADVGNRVDGSWGKTTILLDGSTSDSLLAVPIGGGAPRPATRIYRDQGEAGHAWPFFLPDGEHFLFVTTTTSGRSSHIRLGRLGSLDSYDLGECDSRVEFAPPNYVLFVREATLVAQALDIKKHKLVGDPIPLADGVATNNSGMFSVSHSTLVVGTSATGSKSELIWTDRSGKRLGTAAEPGTYREIALSPDGRRVAMTVEETSGFEDLWVRDLERNIASRLTFDPSDEIWPVWSPEGTHVFYGSDRSGEFLIYRKSAAGVGVEDTLARTGWGPEAPTSVSPDGQWVATASLAGGANWNIGIRPVRGVDVGRLFLATNSQERDGAFSPDGRLFAYRSNETGRNEVYVRSFPDGQSKWQVSNSGGFDPTWTQGGRELIYLGSNNEIMAVPILPGSDFTPGNPVELFRTALTSEGFVERRWDVTRDGKRFLLNVPLGTMRSADFAITKNWRTILARK
jgi:eukaryotic-like serine/threonine-protein kinase